MECLRWILLAIIFFLCLQNTYGRGGARGGGRGGSRGSSGSSYGGSSSYGSNGNSYGGSSSYGSSVNSYGGSSSYESSGNSYGGSSSYGSSGNSYGGSSSYGSSGNSYGSSSNSYGGSSDYGSSGNSYGSSDNSYGGSISHGFSDNSFGGSNSHDTSGSSSRFSGNSHGGSNSHGSSGSSYDGSRNYDSNGNSKGGNDISNRNTHGTRTYAYNRILYWNQQNRNSRHHRGESNDDEHKKLLSIIKPDEIPDSKSPNTATYVCLNGGTRTSGGCECQQNYRGTHCEYHTSNCDIEPLTKGKKVIFNCNHLKNETKCHIMCQNNKVFKRPTVEIYKCTPDGTWTPKRIPRCITPGSSLYKTAT